MDAEGARPPRREDVLRHLEDLRTGSYEGAERREDRQALFRRAVELLDPVVRSVFDETNAAFLRGSGSVEHRSMAEDDAGGAGASWELTWPEQREAANVRAEGDVEPIQVIAWFAAGFTHPHLRGTRAGDWPLQVLDEADAIRQEPIVRAIVEAELHQRIFEGTWRVMPGFTRERPPGGA